MRANLISRTLLFSILSVALACFAPGAHAAKRPELLSAGAARPSLPTSHAADLELPELYTLSIADDVEAGGGQTGGGHSGTLTWTLSTDDTTAQCSVAGANCSQNVYRASGACTQTSPVFTLLSNQAAAAVTYTDATITPGTWCYAVTFEIQSLESLKATAQVSLQAAPVTGLSVVAH